MLTPSIFRFQVAGIALRPVHLIVIPILTGLKGQKLPLAQKKAQNFDQFRINFQLTLYYLSGILSPWHMIFLFFNKNLFRHFWKRAKK